MAGEVRTRYGDFCESHTLTEYYHRIADLTNTSHIVFLANAGIDVHHTVASERMKLALYLDHLLFPLDNTRLKEAHPARANRLNVIEGDRRAEEAALGPRPARFQDYLAFVERALKLLFTMLLLERTVVNTGFDPSLRPVRTPITSNNGHSQRRRSPGNAGDHPGAMPTFPRSSPTRFQPEAPHSPVRASSRRIPSPSVNPAPR